ncbi:hypothetical protein EJ02DRAFT_434296 [Clathrospora elynae]|uniref:Uncharacterized protein n=1 Tax=Clathrospora elynae TaxID=706981 RepID=A0A6A5SN95_9PLEO|nr:hypothetical protein EJ02DRAFT_434296 [Clathrospora elynae]
MSSFHDNKLNQFSLFDSTDDTYSPVKKSTRKRSTKPKAMGNCISNHLLKANKKRKTEANAGNGCNPSLDETAVQEQYQSFNGHGYYNEAIARPAPSYDFTGFSGGQRNILPATLTFGDHDLGANFVRGANLSNDGNVFEDHNVVSYLQPEVGGQDHGPDEFSQIKDEDLEDETVSYAPMYGSEDEGSGLEDRLASNPPKINKDGVPRKPRAPRPKLLKWSDNDWKNVVLGIIWACGETGVQIPFDQAAQVVGQSCTAGALQQAILKLRGRQIAEGYQIPSLRMAWTRKNKDSGTPAFTANAKAAQASTDGKVHQKNPTLNEGTATLIVTLKRAYRDTDRINLVDREAEVPPQDARIVNENHAGSLQLLSHNDENVVGHTGNPFGYPDVELPWSDQCPFFTGNLAHDRRIQVIDGYFVEPVEDPDLNTSSRSSMDLSLENNLPFTTTGSSQDETFTHRRTQRVDLLNGLPMQSSAGEDGVTNPRTTVVYAVGRLDGLVSNEVFSNGQGFYHTEFDAHNAWELIGDDAPRPVPE